MTTEEKQNKFRFRPGELSAKIVSHSIVSSDKKPYVVGIISSFHLLSSCINWMLFVVQKSGKYIEDIENF